MLCLLSPPPSSPSSCSFQPDPSRRLLQGDDEEEDYQGYYVLSKRHSLALTDFKSFAVMEYGYGMEDRDKLEVRYSMREGVLTKPDLCC